MRTAVGSLVTVAFALGAAAASAGTFEAQTPTYKTTLFPTGILVVVDGVAIYRGTWDTNDDHALIQTTAFSSNGDPSGNTGRGFNRNGPFFDGYRLLCTDEQEGCPGRVYIARPNCSYQSQPFYRGRTGSVIYRQYAPEIDTRFGSSFLVPCLDELPEPPPPPETPCDDLFSASPEVLPVVGGPQLKHALPDSPFFLARVEERGGMRYVMEEWAVLVVDREIGGPMFDIHAVAASSGDYAGYRMATLLDGIAASRRFAAEERFDLLGKGSLASYFRSGRSILLSVHEPVHPHNERWIARPVPRLPVVELADHGGAGSAVIRADFDDDRALRDLAVLYADRQLSRGEIGFLESSLRLEYASEKSHRAVLFAVLGLGETFVIQRSLTVLPRCCCQTDPETGECQSPEI